MNKNAIIYLEKYSEEEDYATKGKITGKLEGNIDFNLIYKV